MRVMKAKMKRLLCSSVALVFPVTILFTACHDTKVISNSGQTQSTVKSSHVSATETGDKTQTGTEYESNTTTEGSSATNSSSTNKSVSTSTSSTVNKPLKGYKFKYATAYPHQYVEGSSTVAAYFTSVFRQIESKYGCKIELMNYYNPDNVTNEINTAINAGNKVADIIELPLASARNLARAGALADQKKAGGLKLNNGNFDKVITEGFTFNNKVYGTCFFNSSYSGVFFNIDLIKKYAPNIDVYKLYKSGKWTWDAFRDLAIKTTVDTNNDNKKDIYGFSSNTNVIGLALSSSAGGTVIRKNGKIKVVMCDQPGINALNWLKQMYKDDKVYKYVTNWKDAETAFAEGEVAMFPFFIWAAPQDFGSVVEFDYGFVPFPKENESSSYKASIYSAPIYVMTRTNKDLNKTGIIYNEISSISSKLKNDFINSLEDAGLNSDGIKAFNDLKTFSVLDFSIGVNFGDYSAQVDSTVFQSAKQPASVISSIKTAMQKVCDDYYGQFK